MRERWLRPRRCEQDVPAVEEGRPVPRRRRGARRLTPRRVVHRRVLDGGEVEEVRPPGPITRRAAASWTEVGHQQSAHRSDGSLVRRRDASATSWPASARASAVVGRRAMPASVSRPADRCSTGDPEPAPGSLVRRSRAGSAGRGRVRRRRPAARRGHRRTRRAITPLDRHQLEHDQRVFRWQARGVGNDARGRLDGGDAAAVGGVAQRSADVVARGPAVTSRWPARGASPPLDPPAVTSGSTGCGSGRGASCRCARAGRSRAGWCGRTGWRPRHACVPPRARRAGRRHRRRSVPHGWWPSGDVDVLLDADRDAVQRAERHAVGDGLVGRIGRLLGVLTEERDDGVQIAVHVLHAGEQGMQDLPARRVPTPDPVGQLQRPQLPQLTHAADASRPHRR